MALTAPPSGRSIFSPATAREGGLPAGVADGEWTLTGLVPKRAVMPRCSYSSRTAAPTVGPATGIGCGSGVMSESENRSGPGRRVRRS